MPSLRSARLPALLQAVLPAAPARPVKVYAMDERRLGLHTIRRRRLTARGINPHRRAAAPLRERRSVLYGAIAPADGDAYFLGVPRLTAALFQRFVDSFAQAHTDTFNVLIVEAWTTDSLQTLTAYPFIMTAINALSP